MVFYLQLLRASVDGTYRRAMEISHSLQLSATLSGQGMSMFRKEVSISSKKHYKKKWTQVSASHRSQQYSDRILAAVVPMFVITGAKC